MVHATAFAVFSALLAAMPVNAGLYSKSSPVVQVDAKSYDRLIAQSNYTSIVEFYAPWCGHCKNLQPAYEKAAKSLAGLAKVAAIDCDDEANKAFCGGMGVQGFPTLKIVKPGSKSGKPIVEDYNGPRTAKGIVEVVTDKIPNLVKRVDDKTLEKFLADSKDTPKAVLFSDKGKTSSLLKAVAIDFKGSIVVAQIRNTEKASLELFGVSTFPSLILLPADKDAPSVVYDGEFKKDAIVKFLTQAATPNTDPAPAKVKVKKPKDSKKASKKKEDFESASSKHAKEQASTAGASATDETLVDEPTESPQPIVDAEKPIVLPPASRIPELSGDPELVSECLNPKAGTCILAVLSSSPDEVSSKAINALSEVAHKHRLHKRAQFPFYVLPQNEGGYKAVQSALQLDGFGIIAVNAKRGWWRSLSKGESGYADEDVSEGAIERWVDQIRLGEGEKKKIPEGLVPRQVEREPVAEELVEESVVEEETPEAGVDEPVAEQVQEDVHDEL